MEASRTKGIALLVVAGLIILAFAWSWISEQQRSPAEERCREQLEAELGEEGVVKLENVTETSGGVFTKVEGDLAWREQRGAGDRHQSLMSCQIRGDVETGDVELTIS